MYLLVSMIVAEVPRTNKQGGCNKEKIRAKG